jgi:hypothetical protein
MVENIHASKWIEGSILIIGIGAIFVALYAAVEVYKITRPNNFRDAETSSGTSARKNFLISVSIASFARVTSIVSLVISNYYQLGNTKKVIDPYSSKLIQLSRFLPTCMYITMYTMITLYFAQMCYMVSVNSVPFFQLRGFLMLGNAVIYFSVLFLTLVIPLEPFIYWVLFLSFISLLVSISFYGFSLYKLLPGSTAQQMAVKKITSRFLPLMAICITGLFFGTVYYVIMSINCTYVSPTIDRQRIFDLLIFSLTEVLPSFLIVLLISKKNDSNGTITGGSTDDLRGADSSSRLTQILKSYISSKVYIYIYIYIYIYSYIFMYIYIFICVFIYI